MSRKSWKGVILPTYSAPKDTKRPLPDRQIRMSGKAPPPLLHFRPEIFPLLFIMKKCYIIGRNSNFLAINWS